MIFVKVTKAMRMLMFLSMLILLMIPFPAFAQANVTTNSTQYCLDGNTLRIETERVICIEGQCDNVERIWNNNCEWGCDQRRNECFADPVTRYGWVLLLIFVIIVAIVLLRRFM